MEGANIGEREGEQNACGSSIVGLGDVSKSFLTCGVPYLQFDCFIVIVDNFRLEVDSDGGSVGADKALIGEACDERGFAYSSVSDD